MIHLVNATNALIATTSWLALWCFVLTFRTGNLHSRLSALELSRGVAQELVVRESNLAEPKGKHSGQTGLGAFPTRKGTDR